MFMMLPSKKLFLKVAYYIQFKFFFIFWKKNLSVVNYVPRIYQINYRHSFPDKWGKMAISPIREKSKIKLLFLYTYFLFTLQSFVNDLSMFIFLFSKLGNISDINWFMTWFHLGFIEKLLKFKVAYFVRFIYKLIQVFYIHWIKNLKHQIFFNL